MCTRATLAEVRELQKAAGILNENDIDYSLDEMLDDEDTVNEKRAPNVGPPCGLMDPAGTGRPVQGVKWMLDGHPKGFYTCLMPGRTPDFKVMGYALVPAMNENIQEVVGQGTPCAPGKDGTQYVAYVTGPKPTDIACFPANQPPKNINGKPPQKKVGSPTAPKPGMQAERLQQLAVGDTEGSGGGGPLQCEPGETKWTDGPNSFYCYPTNGPNQPRRTATQHPV